MPQNWLKGSTKHTHNEGKNTHTKHMTENSRPKGKKNFLSKNRKRKNRFQGFTQKIYMVLDIQSNNA